MPTEPYRLILPERRLTGVVFASPHSGRAYPPAFLRASALDERTIRTSEDAFVDLLLDAAPVLGAPLLAALVPRAYLDLNRASDELDSALIEGARLTSHNPRVASGLGVIPRVVAGGKAIYRGKIGMGEAQARLDRWWYPYHGKLQELLNESRAAFGEAVLIDVHSMPHEAVDAIARTGARRPEIVIGDRYGASAGAHLVEAVEDAFRAEGLTVLRNAPFAGAYITQVYGRPSHRQHAMQIEIDRSLYMNEQEIRPNGNFGAFQKLMGRVMAAIIGAARGRVSLAAE